MKKKKKKRKEIQAAHLATFVATSYRITIWFIHRMTHRLLSVGTSNAPSLHATLSRNACDFFPATCYIQLAR